MLQQVKHFKTKRRAMVMGAGIIAAVLCLGCIATLAVMGVRDAQHARASFYTQFNRTCDCRLNAWRWDNHLESKKTERTLDVTAWCPLFKEFNVIFLESEESSRRIVYSNAINQTCYTDLKTVSFAPSASHTTTLRFVCDCRLNAWWWHISTSGTTEAKTNGTLLDVTVYCRLVNESNMTFVSKEDSSDSRIEYSNAINQTCFTDLKTVAFHVPDRTLGSGNTERDGYIAGMFIFSLLAFIAALFACSNDGVC